MVSLEIVVSPAFNSMVDDVDPLDTESVMESNFTEMLDICPSKSSAIPSTCRRISLADLDSYNELKKYTEPYSPKKDEYESFVYLKRDGYVKIHHFATVDLGRLGRSQAPDSYIITQAGRDALSEFEKVRDQQTKDERQQRFQNKVSVLSVLVPLATFFLGLVVEHYAGIIAWFSEHG